MEVRQVVCVVLTIYAHYGAVAQIPPSSPEAEDAPPFLRYGSEVCIELSECDGELNFPDKNCFCDDLCYIMGDCCGNIEKFVPDPPDYFLQKEQFVCSRVSGLVKIVDSYGVLLVSRCHSGWTDNNTRSLCEGDAYYFNENILLRTPVSDIHHIMYRNMYCAYCNYAYDIQFWNPEYHCVNETGVRHIPGSADCLLNFNAPTSAYKKRLCSLIPPVSTCPADADSELVANCSTNPYYLVYNDFNGNQMYRNEYCAMCQGLGVDRIWCENILPGITDGVTIDPRAPPYSFRLLVDFNSRLLNVNGTVQTDSEEKKCRDDEIYDFLYGICRSIVCVSPAEPAAGRCIILAAHSPEGSHDLDNCTWVKFGEGEYRIVNDSRLFILSQDKVYIAGEYTKNGSDVFICLDRNQSCLHDCNTPGVKFNFDKAESLLSTIGLIISIVSLTVTFIIYVCFAQQLMNTPGKILICLIIALWMAQLLFLLSAQVQGIHGLCTAFAVAIHYFFLAAFCWMNVISFDLWMTFSNTFGRSGSSSGSGKRLRMYHIYAWLIPFLIVCVAVVLDFSEFNLDVVNLKPGYGEGVCWISSRDALLLFFIGPLALFKTVDVISFIFTAVNIAKAKRQGAMARRKKNTCSLLINIKLSLVMGLTWVFAFVGNATNLTAFWYLFIVFNTLQGLFIALSFLCTKKVGRLLHERYEVVTSSFSKSTASGTQLTNVSKST